MDPIYKFKYHNPFAVAIDVAVTVVAVKGGREGGGEKEGEKKSELKIFLQLEMERHRVTPSEGVKKE